MKDKAASRDQFQDTFVALKAILKPYEPGMAVQTDEPTDFCLNTGKLLRKRPVMFGAVRTGKSYVSFHLMPVYGCPDLVAGLSDALRARMQGKACFNFKTIEPALLQELTHLTEQGYRAFKRAGYA